MKKRIIGLVLALVMPLVTFSGSGLAAGGPEINVSTDNTPAQGVMRGTVEFAFLKMTLSTTANETRPVDSMTFRRIGISMDKDVENLNLHRDTTALGHIVPSLNDEHEAVFSFDAPIVIGDECQMTLYSNISLSTFLGNTIGFKLVSITYNGVEVPFTGEAKGNTMTVIPSHGPIEHSVQIDAPTKVMPNDNFAISINISEVVDLSAVQYDILFDPEVLQLGEITEGQINSTTIGVIHNQIVPGEVRVVQSMGLSKVSGSGYLAIAHFNVVSTEAGFTEISLDNGLISNFQAEAISATWNGASIEIFIAPRGDVNNDGVVDVKDMAKLARIILRLDEPTNTADVNNDGSINIFDIVEVGKIILK